MESDSSVERLQEEWKKRIPMLSINTLPDWALKEFLSYAETFGGDRGMALTELLSERKRIGGEVIIALIQDLDERIRRLEGPGSKGLHNLDGKIIKFADGREIRIGVLGGK